MKIYIYSLLRIIMNIRYIKIIILENASVERSKLKLKNITSL
jgi:hypothetical protein